MNRTLSIILVLGLVHGLLYVFLEPPWQHYDEPTHFEYAWLIANRAALPQGDDFDQGMRREVAASMLEHGFFNNLSYRPNLVSSTPVTRSQLLPAFTIPAFFLVRIIPGAAIPLVISL